MTEGHIYINQHAFCHSILEVALHTDPSLCSMGLVVQEVAGRVCRMGQGMVCIDLLGEGGICLHNKDHPCTGLAVAAFHLEGTALVDC